MHWEYFIQVIKVTFYSYRLGAEYLNIRERRNPRCVNTWQFMGMCFWLQAKHVHAHMNTAVVSLQHYVMFFHKRKEWRLLLFCSKEGRLYILYGTLYTAVLWYVIYWKFSVCNRPPKGRHVGLEDEEKSKTWSLDRII